MTAARGGTTGSGPVELALPAPHPLPGPARAVRDIEAAPRERAPSGTVQLLHSPGTMTALSVVVR